MKVAILVAPLLVLLPSCARARPVPSSLQRFHALLPQLAAVTNRSAHVSVDVETLALALKASSAPRARGAAVSLKRDALLLCQISGLAAARIRRLASHRTSYPLHRFYMIVLQTLAWEWQEGQTLRALADAVWQNPFMTTHPAEHHVEQLSSAAAYDSLMAVHSGEKAAGWRRRHRRAFRYVPVPTGKRTKQKRHTRGG